MCDVVTCATCLQANIEWIGHFNDDGCRVDVHLHGCDAERAAGGGLCVRTTLYGRNSYAISDVCPSLPSCSCSVCRGVCDFDDTRAIGVACARLSLSVVYLR